jgi:mono/diheme cytochrome c family protein
MTTKPGVVGACLCVAAASWALAAAPGGNVVKGKSVYSGSCAVCHLADSAATKMGPGLKGLFQRAKLKNGQKVAEASVRARIEQGGSGMPAFKDMLTDGEKSDLIAYLKTL